MRGLSKLTSILRQGGESSLASALCSQRLEIHQSAMSMDIRINAKEGKVLHPDLLNAQVLKTQVRSPSSPLDRESMLANSIASSAGECVAPAHPTTPTH